MNSSVDFQVPQTKQTNESIENASGLSEQLSTYEQSEHKVKSDLDKYAKLIKDTDLKVDQLREEIVHQIDQATDRFNIISDDKSIPHKKLSQLSDKISHLNLTLDDLKRNDDTIKYLRQDIDKLRDELEVVNLKKDAVAKDLETLIYQEMALTSPNSVIADPNVSASKSQLNKIRRSRQTLERQLDSFLRKIKAIEEKLKKNFSKLNMQRQSIENFWKKHLDSSFKADIQEQPQLDFTEDDPWSEVLASDPIKPTESTEPTEATESTEPTESTEFAELAPEDDNQSEEDAEQNDDAVEMNSIDENNQNENEQINQADEEDLEEPATQTENPGFVQQANNFENTRFNQTNNFNFAPNATRRIELGNHHDQFRQARPMNFDRRSNKSFFVDTNRNPNFARGTSQSTQRLAPNVNKNPNFVPTNNQPNQMFAPNANQNQHFARVTNQSTQSFIPDTNKNPDFVPTNNQPNQMFASGNDKSPNFVSTSDQSSQVFARNDDQKQNLAWTNNQLNQNFVPDANKNPNFVPTNNQPNQMFARNDDQKQNLAWTNNQLNQNFVPDANKNPNFVPASDQSSQVFTRNDDQKQNLAWTNNQLNQNFVPDANKNPNFVPASDQSSQVFTRNDDQKQNFAWANNQLNQEFSANLNKEIDFPAENNLIDQSFSEGITSTFFTPEYEKKLFGEDDLLKTKSLEEELKSSLLAPEKEKLNLDKQPSPAKINSFDQKEMSSQKSKLDKQTHDSKKASGDRWPNEVFFSLDARRTNFDKDTQETKNLNFSEETKKFGKNDPGSDDQLPNKSVNIMNDNNQIIDERKTKNMDYNNSFSRGLGGSRDAGSVSQDAQPSSRGQLTKKIDEVDFSQETLVNARPEFLKSEQFQQPNRFNQSERPLADNQPDQTEFFAKSNQFFNQNERLSRNVPLSKIKQTEQGGRSFDNSKVNQNDVSFPNEQVFSAWASNNAGTKSSSGRLRSQQNTGLEISNVTSALATQQKNSSKPKPNHYEFIGALDERLNLCKEFLESSEINATIVERFVKELNDISAYFQNLISQLQKNFSLIVLFKNDVLRLLPDKQKICDRFTNFNAKGQSTEAKKEYNFFFSFYDEFKRRFNAVRVKIFTDLDLFNSFTNDLKEIFTWVKESVSAEDPVFWIDCNEVLEFWASLRSHYDRSANNANALDSMLGKILKKIESRIDNLDTDLESIANQVSLVINDSDSFANIWDDSAAKADELIGSIQTISNALSMCVQELNSIFDEAVRNIDDGSNTMVISQINRALEYFYNSKGIFANQIKDFDFRFSEVKYSYEQFLTKKQTIVEREKEINLAINSVNSNQYVLTEWIKQCRLTLDNSLNSLRIFSQKIALNQQRLFASYNAFLNKYTNVREHVLAIKEKEKWQKEPDRKENPENYSFSVQKFFENSLTNLETDKSSNTDSFFESEKTEEIRKSLMHKTESLLNQLSEYNTGEVDHTKSVTEQIDSTKPY